MIKNIILTSTYFIDIYEKGYVDAIYIKDYEIIPKRGKCNPAAEQLKNQDKVSIYHKYIETSANLDYDDLREAIENKNYVKNECWLNAITEYYIKNLFQHKKITRGTILELINKTEDNIKDGISVIEVLPLF